VTNFKALPIASVALSFLLARSAAAQVAPAPAPEGEPQVVPAPGDSSSIVQVPPEASESPPPPPPTLAASPPLAAPDDGLPFFVAATVGVGELWIKNDAAQTWGQTVPFEISGGVTLTPDLALFAAGYFARIVYPISDRAWTNTLDLRAAGLGMKFHLPGPNIFVAGSASISRLHVDYATSGWQDETSLWGILGRLSVGRQWRASRDWSLGLAGELLLGRMAWGDPPPPPQPTPYIARGFALQFSGAFGAASAASIVASEPSSGRHTHDTFFLNASAGLGKLWLSGGDVNSDNHISGGSRTLDLSAGYAITGSFVLFGAFFEVFAPNPANATQPLADLEVHGVGPGVRYYLSSFNVFVEGALPVSRIGFHNRDAGDDRYGTNEISDWRPMPRAAIGWEGWVSANWGLGVAAEGLLGRAPSKIRPNSESGPSFTVKGLSLNLSATYN